MQLDRWSAPATAGGLSGWSRDLHEDTVVIFLHGNGLCSRVYDPFWSRVEHPAGLIMIDAPGQGENPTIDTFAGWQADADRIHDTCQYWCNQLPGKRLILSGHSYGSTIALILLSRSPELFVGALLQDPAWFAPWMLALAWPLEKAHLLGFHALARKTRLAAEHWPDRTRASDWLRNRSAYRRCHPECLDALVQYALEDSDNGVHLRCTRSLEANIFGTMPYMLPRCVRTLTVPTELQTGTNTDWWFQSALNSYRSRNRAISHNEVPGSHIFMLEDPISAAASATQALKRLTGST